MKKYKIEITETLQKVIEIEADNEETAILIAKMKYRNQEVILDENDFIEVGFKPFDRQ